MKLSKLHFSYIIAKLDDAGICFNIVRHRKAKKDDKLLKKYEVHLNFQIMKHYKTRNSCRKYIALRFCKQFNVPFENLDQFIQLKLARNEHNPSTARIYQRTATSTRLSSNRK